MTRQEIFTKWDFLSEVTPELARKFMIAFTIMMLCKETDFVQALMNLDKDEEK